MGRSADSDAGDDPGFEYRIALVLAVPCATCGVQRSARANMCPDCGGDLDQESLDTVRAAVKQRRRAFKGRLERLEARADEIADRAQFATSGASMDAEDYRVNVLVPALEAEPARTEAVRRLLEADGWDPDAPDCIGRFTQLVTVLDRALDSVAEMERLPPPAWRGVHRQFVRAAKNHVRGQIRMASAIAAADLDDALTRQNEGQAALDEAARQADTVARMTDLIAHEPSDGPFQVDGAIDLAGLAWSGVRGSPTPLGEVADLVRTDWRAISTLTAVPDHHVVSLPPMLTAGVRVTDQELLAHRVDQLHAILIAADAADPGWIDDTDLCVVRAVRGLERVDTEAERLGVSWRYDLPRSFVMRMLTEAYRELVEGALVDLGTIVMIAARVVRSDADQQLLP